MVRLLAIVGLLLASVSYADEDFHTRYFRSVFHGDLSWVEESEADGELKSKFDAFFVDQQIPEEVVGIEDDFVREAAKYHLAYWRAALLNPAQSESAQSELRESIENLLEAHGAPNDGELSDRLAAEIERRGYGFRGGRTPPLFDFMLWRRTDTQTYEVELTDGRQEVVVHLLRDFIMEGWANFATFGAAGTGGWADPDALYAFADDYDLESERFLNSYLRHEARHFADYALYPNLAPADLEYRAKLTELIFASDVQKLLAMFEGHAVRESSAPHPLANWHVLNDLRVALGTEELTDQPAEEISKISKRLLDDHDAKLIAAGQETTRGLLDNSP